jgi:PAS domain S-box-containing protein
MSTETLIQRAQVDLVTLYSGLTTLTNLVSKLSDPAIANEANTLLVKLRSSLDKLQSRISDQDKEHSQTRSLFAISRAINSTLDLDVLLSMVMDMIIHVTNAERAFLMLIDRETQQLTFKVARGIDRQVLDTEDGQVSRSIVERVAREHTPVVTTNAQEDPRFKNQESIISFNLRSILCVPLRVKGETIGVIYADNRIKSGVFGNRERDLLVAFADQAAVAIENARLFAETNQRLREVTTLQGVSQVITSQLDLGFVLKTISEEARRAIKNASKVLIHMPDERGQLVARAIAYPPGAVVPIDGALEGRGIARVAFEQRRVLNVPNTQTDANFVDTGSGLRSLLVAPLLVGERVLGTLTVDSDQLAAFDPSAERLLRALANQAAIAIENARLFEEQKQNLAEISALKMFQDNIFASIASGVITTDTENLITTFNRAAERILNLRAADVLQQHFEEALPFIKDATLPLLESVKEQGDPILSYEVQPQLPLRGPLTLSLSMSALRDASAATRLGVAIVVEDLTEKKKLQAREEMFGRYLAPSVIKRLPDDPRELRLGGQRQTVSILFADIRGYSAFSEHISPEQLVDILNQYLSRAAQAVLHEEGTLDKFIGDAVMAFWNAPEAQPDHTQRAVRAAWRLRSAILEHQLHMPPEQRLSFGVGLHVGDAVVGNIGTERALNYTVIGDAVNLAKRLQEGALANQIVLSDALYQSLRAVIEVKPLEATQVRGRTTWETRWELVGVRF